MTAMRFVVRYLEEAVSAILLAALCLATIANVASRYALNHPIPWAEEFARYAFIWLVFMGAASCSKHGRHISIDILYNIIPRHLQKLFMILSYIATFSLLFVFIYSGTRLAIRATYPTAAMGIPTTYVYMIVPISALLIMSRMTGRFWSSLRPSAGELRP